MTQRLATLLFAATVLYSGVTLASLPPCPESKPKHNCVGTEDYSNGNKYVGEFRSGKPDGYGTYTYSNGEAAECR